MSLTIPGPPGLPGLPGLCLSTSEYGKFDDAEYRYACRQSNMLFSKINDHLKVNYAYYSLLSFENNSCDFKIINIQTNDGIQICFPPYNISTIEMYYIINKKRNIKNIILLNLDTIVSDIYYHINKHMFNAYIQKDMINVVFRDFTEYINQINEKYYVIKNDYNFSLIEKSTNNGYNFYIDLNKNSYVCIRIIQKNASFDYEKYIVSQDDYDSAHQYIVESISSNKHNNKINVYAMIRFDVDENVVLRRVSSSASIISDTFSDASSSTSTTLSNASTIMHTTRYDAEHDMSLEYDPE